MSLSSYFFRKILRSEISFNWVPPSENAQTWRRPLGSASHQWQTRAGPCVSFSPCHCEPLSFSLCKLDITMGNLRPYAIDPYLCGPYSSSPSPTQPKKKKCVKNFLNVPIPMNRTWSPLPTHDGGQKVTETQAVSPSRCKDRILLTWNTSPLTVAPMSSEADRKRTRRQHYSLLSL